MVKTQVTPERLETIIQEEIKGNVYYSRANISQCCPPIAHCSQFEYSCGLHNAIHSDSKFLCGPDPLW